MLWEIAAERDAQSPNWPKGPALIKLSTVFLLTLLKSTFLAKSVIDLKFPPLSRAVRIESMAAVPTFFMADKAKRLRPFPDDCSRSEERRVGKEWRSRW